MTIIHSESVLPNQISLHNFKLRILIAVSIALLVTASAASLVFGKENPVNNDNNSIYELRGLRIIDGNRSAVIEDGTIVIRGRHIAVVGPSVEIAPIPNAKIIDYHGKTAFPGLISDHSHLGLTDGLKTGTSCYTRENITRQLKQYEDCGVTTVTSLGVNLPLFYEIQKQAHSGAQEGSDIFGADVGVGVKNGAPPFAEPSLYRPQSIEEARIAVQEMAKRKPSFIKIWVDDFHGAVPMKMKPEIYKAIIVEAHKHGLRVAAHVFYLEDAKKLIADGVDVLAHGIRDKEVDSDFIQAIKGSNAWYIPTLELDESTFIYASHPELLEQPFLKNHLQPAVLEQLKDSKWRKQTLANNATEQAEKALSVNKRNLKLLYDAGVKIGFGTDSGATIYRIQGYAEHRELQLMTEAGLTALQAISIATKAAAQLLDLSDRGVLAEGKLADIVIVDGKPDKTIEDTSKIQDVWHFGKQHEVKK